MEASISMHTKGECISEVSASESVAGKRTVYVGTWENRNISNGSCRGSEKATKTKRTLKSFSAMTNMTNSCTLSE